MSETKDTIQQAKDIHAQSGLLVHLDADKRRLENSLQEIHAMDAADRVEASTALISVAITYQQTYEYNDSWFANHRQQLQPPAIQWLQKAVFRGQERWVCNCNDCTRSRGRLPENLLLQGMDVDMIYKTLAATHRNYARSLHAAAKDFKASQKQLQE